MDVNQIKDRIQNSALQVIEEDKHHRAKLFMATGTGKSRVPILYIKKYDLSDICLLVPTTKLKNEDWPKEFKKWGAEKYLERTTRVCLRSCHKIKGKVFRLLIVDEVHNIKENFIEFLNNNVIGAIILLTGTKPKLGNPKRALLDSLDIDSEFIITLPQARELGLVAPFKIHVVSVELDNTEKYVPAGTKEKPFYITETNASEYLAKNIEYAERSHDYVRKKYFQNKRMHFIYSLRSKHKAAKLISDKILSPKDKVLIFMGNSAAADFVSKHTFHSNIPKKEREANFKMFDEGSIMRLACCLSLNEGANIEGINKALAGQLNSQEKDFLQRLGRLLRFRDGHTGELIVLVAKGTQDENWVKEALESIPEEDIMYYTLQEFLIAYGNQS